MSIESHLVASTVCCGLILAGSPAVAQSLASQDPLLGWHAQTSTGAISLVKVENRRTYTTFALENVSSRLATAFAVSFTAAGETHNHYLDYLDGETPGLAPGAVYILRIASTEVIGNTDRVLFIDAAVFEDGSSDGNPAQAAFIDLRRMGRAFELERIRNILINPGSQESVGLKDRLRSAVGELPATIEQAIPSLAGVEIPDTSLAEIALADRSGRSAFLEGIRNAREDGLLKVARLTDSGPGSLQIATLLGELEKRRVRVRSYAEKRREGGQQR